MITLTKEKLYEIIKEIEDEEKMEYYYQLALKGEFEVYQHTGFVALFAILIKYKHEKLFPDFVIDTKKFFGLSTIDEDSEYWQFYKLLERTYFEIVFCLVKKEQIPKESVVEICQIFSLVLFLFGHYLKCLHICTQILSVDPDNSFCSFLKASIIDICYLNETPDAYKIALLNLQRELISKCNPQKVMIRTDQYEEVLEKINEKTKVFGDAEKQIKFMHVSDDIEQNKKIANGWTEEHEYYLKNDLFLNPLSSYGDFFEACTEELVEISKINKDCKELLNEIIDDYKLCRSFVYSYNNKQNNIGKREMSIAYSYAYSIFDKIAYLICKIYNLDVEDDKISFTKHGLFDLKIKGTDIQFKKIKNNNIIPLYIMMKEVREKQKRENAISVGTWELNELRNTIDHKSIALVNESSLKRSSLILLKQTRDLILYTIMLLYSCPIKPDENNLTAIKNTLLSVIVKEESEN